MSDYAFELFLMVVIAPLLLFFMMREIFCWYWKVNDQLSTLKEISKKLDRLAVLEEKLGKMVPETETASEETV